MSSLFLPPRIRSLSVVLGMVLALPAVLFISSNVLKYELGLLPGIEIAPVHPAILLGGAVAAVLLNAWDVLEFRLDRQDDTVWLIFGLVKRPWNWAVLLLAALFLSLLLGYAVVENAAGLLAG